MVRSIPLGRRSVTGRLQSRFGKELAYESRLEKDALVLLQFDQWVTDLEVQPFEIRADGIARHYTPDILATWQSASHSPYGRARAIIEVKDRKTLRREAQTLEPRFNAIRRYCEGQDLPFVIMTEDHIRIPMWKAADDLLPYWYEALEPSVWLSIAATISDQGEAATVGSVTLGLMDAGMSVDVVKPAIYHFLARRRLLTDLDRPIDNDTPLTVTAEGHEHAVEQL